MITIFKVKEMSIEQVKNIIVVLCILSGIIIVFEPVAYGWCDDYKERIKWLEDERDLRDKHIAKLEGHLVESQQELEIITSRLEEVTKQKKDLETFLLEAQASVGTLTEQAKTTKAEVKTLTTQFKEAQTKISTLQQELQHEKQQKELYQQQLQENKAQLQDSQDHVSQLRIQLQTTLDEKDSSQNSSFIAQRYLYISIATGLIGSALMLFVGIGLGTRARRDSRQQYHLERG